MSRKNENKKGANGAGSIRKITTTRNGKEYTYWQGRYTEGYDACTGKQIQRSITGKTQKEVAQNLRQITAEIDAKTYVAPCKLSISEWMSIWAQDYLVGVKASTAYLYRRTIELYIDPHLGHIRLDALNAHTVQHFYNELAKPSKLGVAPLSAKSIKNIHGVLHKALKQAVLIGYLRTNPSEACILPRIIRKEMHPLEEDQVAVFLREVQGHPHEYLYKIALFTGLRESEVLGLSWEHIDFQTGTLTVKRQLRREQKKDGLIFTNQTGGYLSYRTVYDCFKRIVRNIGAPATRFHDLRHTFAVASIKSGDDIKTVQSNLGHATAAFTLDVYGHFTDDMRSVSAQRMEGFITNVLNL